MKMGQGIGAYAGVGRIRLIWPYLVFNMAGQGPVLLDVTATHHNVLAGPANRDGFRFRDLHTPDNSAQGATVVSYWHCTPHGPWFSI